MAQAHFPRPGPRPAADHPGVAHGVVRRTKRPCRHQRMALGKRAGHAMDLRGLERLLQAQARQNGGETPGKHRLARTRRPDHQQIVPAGRRDFQRSLGDRLASDLGEIHAVRCGRSERRSDIRPCQRKPHPPRQKPADLTQRCGGAHLEPLHQRRFRCVWGRHDQTPRPVCAGALGHRKGAAHGSDITLEPDLTQHDELRQRTRRDLATGDEDPERDGEIEARAGLRPVGRGQVDRDAPERKLEARVHDCGVHPFPALLHRALGQPDGRERGQAIGKIDLDLDRIGIDAEHSGGPDASEHGGEGWRRHRG